MVFIARMLFCTILSGWVIFDIRLFKIYSIYNFALTNLSVVAFIVCHVDNCGKNYNILFGFRIYVIPFFRVNYNMLLSLQFEQFSF